MVTGASGGIGSAVAEQFVDGVARVGRPTTLILSDREAGPLDDTVKHLSTVAGGVCTVRGIPTDVADEDAVASLFTMAGQAGRLTRVVHAAGILGVGGRIVDNRVEDYDRVFAVNSRGTFLVVREAARVMVAQGTDGDDRSVTVVSSNAAGVPRHGMGVYAASKAAVSSLTRSLGLEVAAEGIRCNVVNPGSTDTAMQRDYWGADPAAGRDRVITGDLSTARLGIPLGRIADPCDIAGVVTFLSSSAARHVILQEIYVDGGATLHA